MKTKSMYLISLQALFFSLLLIVGLSEGAIHFFSHESNVSLGEERNEERGVNSCQITLIPHQGNLSSDLKIVDYQEKINAAKDALPYFENLAWAYIQKARESFDEGYYLLAQHTAYCMQSQDAGSLDAFLILGHVYHSRHEFKRAETIAQHLIDERGRWFDFALLGDVLMEQGRLEDAVEAYQKMMDQKPGPQAYSRAAHMRWLKGDLEGAIQLMGMVVQSTHHINKETLAWSLSRLSLYELQEKEYARANAHAQTALSILPHYAPAHLALSRLHLAQEQWDEAIAYAKNAVASYPQIEPLWILHEAYSAAGQYQDAINVQKQLVESGKAEDPRTYSLYLSTFNTQTNVALELAHQEISDRTDVHTLDALAWALTSAGYHQEAYDIGKHVVQENTQDARFFYHLSVIAHRVGRADEAIRWREKALDLQHMLLPSEKKNLNFEFVTASLQAPQLAATILLAN